MMVGRKFPTKQEVATLIRVKKFSDFVCYTVIIILNNL